MGFRITTNMMMNSYRYNLQGSTKKLSDARDMVLTQRNFNSYAEDPAAATQEFRLRRDYYNTYSQLNNTKNVYSKYNTAWNNLAGIVENLSDATARVASIRGNNGTAGESRSALAIVLRETSESVVHAMNQKLGDQFIFAGNDGLNVPFEWRGEDLYYRGINVNAGSVEKPMAADPGWMGPNGTLKPANMTDDEKAWYDYYTHATDVKPDTTEPGWLSDPAVVGNPLTDEAKGWISYYKHEAGKPTAKEPAWGDLNANGVPEKMPATSTDPVEKGWIAYYNDQANVAKLKQMADEQLYIDLGMGLAEHTANNAVNGSYFNSALAGVDFMGYGTDEDGDPKNLSLIMRELADVFQAWDEDIDPQGYNPDLAGPSAQGLSSKELEDKAFRLMDKLKAAQEHITEKWDELDAQSVFLVTNQERLETQMTDTNTQILDISQVDLADAITNFSWQQYCYNAALKIGNQLLSQSLIDYMS